LLFLIIFYLLLLFYGFILLFFFLNFIFIFILFQTVQELNAKVKTLEIQLRSRPHSPTTQTHPHPLLVDRTHSRPNLFKPVESARPIPLSTPNTPTPNSSVMGIPMMEILVEENAIETKKRELEITKEFTNREALTPRDAVSPRDSM
jgi:hypothetical protein